MAWHVREEEIEQKKNDSPDQNQKTTVRTIYTFVEQTHSANIYYIYSTSVLRRFFFGCLYSANVLVYIVCLWLCILLYLYLMQTFLLNRGLFLIFGSSIFHFSETVSYFYSHFIHACIRTRSHI